MNIWDAEIDEFNLTMPFDLCSEVVINPKNIIIVSGTKSSGKTAFLLNIVKDNMNRYEIIYLNSEMGETEFKKRLLLFKKEMDINLKEWKFKPYPVTNNFHDYVTEDPKIWIIDYMEDIESPWKVGKQIAQVHEKLKNGICFIALQKNPGAETARGKFYTMDRCRLYLNLEYKKEERKNYVQIMEAKEFRNQNPRGLLREYSIINGCKLRSKTEWINKEEMEVKNKWL